jgi:hypothetical protein
MAIAAVVVAQRRQQLTKVISSTDCNDGSIEDVGCGQRGKMLLVSLAKPPTDSNADGWVSSAAAPFLAIFVCGVSHAGRGLKQDRNEI